MSMERLPKGFGGIVKMKGKRRNPYMVRIKVGTIINMEKGVAYPEYKIIGYAKMLQLRHNDVKHLLNIVAKWLHRLSLIIPLQFELPVTL